MRPCMRMLGELMEILSKGVTMGAECPGGAECPRGAGETGPGTDYGFVQIIVERSYL